MTHTIISITEAGCKGTGRKSDNQDRLVTRVIEKVWGLDAAPVYVIAVADGISQSAFGGSVARYVTSHIEKDHMFLDPGLSPAIQFGDFIREIKQRFREDNAQLPDMLGSGCTLSVAIVYGDRADILWVGDSPVFHSKATGSTFETVCVTVADQKLGMLTDCFSGMSPCNLKHRQLVVGIGDIITCATDGLKADPDGLSQIYATIGFCSKTTVEFIKRSAVGNYYDDITVVAAQRVK